MLVDGYSVGTVERYTFENIRSSHTIEAVFEAERQTADPDETGVSGWLNTKDHFAYLTGYDTGTFGPNNNMTRAEAVTITARLLADEDYFKKCTASYCDVASDAWYSPYIGFMQTLNMLTPIARDNGRAFAPDEKITRGEFTQLMFSVYSGGNPEGSDRIKMRTLSDVNKNTQYSTAIYGAVNAGLVAGYDDGTFRPEKTLTREQMAVMLARYYARSGVTTQGSLDFADAAKISGWAVDGVSVCVGLGLVQGDLRGRFLPQSRLTRAQIASILVRMAG